MVDLINVSILAAMKQKILPFILILVLNVFFCLSVSEAQRSGNPFDIQDAPPEETAIQEQVPITGNPFDLRLPPKGEKYTPASPKSGTRPTEVLSEETVVSGRFRFSLVLAILALLTLGVSLFRSIIQKAYRSFLNDNFLNQMHREQIGLIAWPYMVLYLVFFIQLGSFIYLSGLERGWFEDQDHWQNLGLVIAGVAGLIILKHLALIVIGNLYPIGKETGQYSFSIVIFGIIAGLVLTPFNLLLAYGPESIRPILVLSGLIMLLLIYLYRSIRGVLIGGRFIAQHQFHFLLYICTIEIAPILWLFKFVESQGV